MQAHWYRSSRGLTSLLLPVGLLFRFLVAVRRSLYRLHLFRVTHLPVPVIVVGNITTGGTGKTPLVIAIAQHLRKSGWKPGVVSRGYGATTGFPREIVATDDALEVGDEPLLLALKSGVPVWIGHDRPRVAQSLLRRHPDCDVLISDDGLQHYALARDIEIAVIDGERGFGNGFMLPAGPLREPVSRLGSADAVIVNGGGLLERIAGPPQFAMRFTGDCFRNLLRPELKAFADEFRGKQLHAIAGIGNPQRFFNHLGALGLAFTSHSFPDHHRFTLSDLDVGAEAILMTEKDAVKCRSFARDTWWTLPIEATVSADFFDFLKRKLNGRKASRHPGLSAVQESSHLQEKRRGADLQTVPTRVSDPG